MKSVRDHGHLAIRALVRRAIYDRNHQLRSIARQAFFEFARPFTDSIAVDRDGLRCYVQTSDEIMGLEIFMHGLLDGDQMAKVVELLREHGGELRGRWFIDVGSNIGTATLCALARFGAARALAIEPAPENHRLLRCNLVANGLEARAVTVEAAVSDEAGRAVLEFAQFNSGAHELRRDGEEIQGKSVSVPVVTLDDMVADYVGGEQIGLLWIDVQAHEANVLAGGPKVLAAGPPTVIEYWPAALERNGSLERLHSLIAKHFQLAIDLDAGLTLEAAEVPSLAGKYPTRAMFTNLLLLR